MTISSLTKSEIQSDFQKLRHHLKSVGLRLVDLMNMAMTLYANVVLMHHDTAPSQFLNDMFFEDCCSLMFSQGYLSSSDLLQSVGEQIKELLRDQVLQKACWTSSDHGQAKSSWKACPRTPSNLFALLLLFERTPISPRRTRMGKILRGGIPHFFILGGGCPWIPLAGVVQSSEQWMWFVFSATYPFVYPLLT